MAYYSRLTSLCWKGKTLALVCFIARQHPVMHPESLEDESLAFESDSFVYMPFSSLIVCHGDEPELLSFWPVHTNE